MMQEGSSVDIRKMSEIDIPSVIEMGLSTLELQTGTDAAQFYSPETLRQWVADKNGVAFVARTNEDLAGFALGYYMAGPRDGYLNAITVKSEYRSRGAGASLLKAALDKFETLGCNHVFMVVKSDNPTALDFFQNNRFQVGEVFRYVETMLPQY